jgi:hypothetical protein
MSEMIGTFIVSDSLAIEGLFDWPSMRVFDIKDIYVEPRYPYNYYVVEAESEHFKGGPGLYNIIMRKDEGKEPYVLRADKVEE